MSGYGTIPYGLGLYGLGGAGPLSVVSAQASSERTVVVTLTRPPLQSSSIGTGDATNPASWSITRADDGTVFHVLSARVLGDPSQVEIYTLEKFFEFSILHLVSCPGLLDQTGALILLPSSATFAGCRAVPQISAAARGESTDLANPQTSENDTAGVYHVDSSGDYKDVSGIPYLQKLIIRRLTTSPGGFFHLPSYGLGISVKSPLKTADMGKLKAQIELQLAREPEFSAVSVRVTLSNDGILTILVRALLSKTNQEVSVPIPVVQSTSDQ